ncbi:TPA: restriction endonuclease subunit R [Streptococcus pneumoniae]|nr:restriction endonuclease subunit R [Streptococcus pneumoniae]HEV8763429.1 restriction endonuclease subunit R [Streptococcus pneumoniae]HEV8767433.1 restriction endonuclease subunit R [Streptococcus pneumoniae]
MVEFIKSKKEMSEEDIKANFITPAIVSKGWKNGEHIAYEEYFTDGRIEVRGDKARRKEGKKSDYSLYYQFELELQLLRQRIINTAFEQDYNKLLNMERF